MEFPPDMPEHQEAREIRALQPIPQKYEEAVRFMQNKVFLATPRHRAQQWRANRNQAHPDILAFEKAFIRRFRKLGIPMFAHCVVRENAEQQRLFIQGRTMAKPGQSPHNEGKAVDLVHGTRAWEVPKTCWDLIGHIGKEVAAQLGVKVVWGGDWRFYDPAHWELAGWENYPAAYTVDPFELEKLLEYYSATA